MIKNKIQTLYVLCLFLIVILTACYSPLDNTSRISPCTSTMLDSSWEREGATGFSYTWIDYTNTTDTDCTLQTPPVLHLTDINNKPLEVNYEIKRYEADPFMPELNFETTTSSDEIILPASKTAQLIVRWVSVCPPETPNGMIAHLLLTGSNDVVKTIIVDGSRTCSEVWTPQVTITGYKNIKQ
ncbi:MAG: hypothetical protein GFH27_549321n9 [Chloroflexi bacterium AL-W]|nr:hypothetical protein [Chloroflexi bacterium AL-N1]NOK64887.1 hypothetical protein [Chloroflexi bacterium AL-N10]NOK76657.1 hypothetical protein [Chloroflexi bacterium AL-N5]NOK84548.1 hypothetical protein [Chloroflexi bacterium AL-W]NOK86627.1 hypothetical protein [Chloroflexi bacterium AL-N15]